MTKKIISIAVALLFSLGVVGISMASSCKGTVEKNDGGELVIKLKGKCKAKAGDKVKVKVKSGAAIEGC